MIEVLANDVVIEVFVAAKFFGPDAEIFFFVWTIEEVESAAGCRGGSRLFLRALETHEEVHICSDVTAVRGPLGQDFPAHNKLAEDVRIDFTMLYPATHCVGVGVQSWALALQQCLGQPAGVSDHTGALMIG